MINIREIRIGNWVSTDGIPFDTTIGSFYEVKGIIDFMNDKNTVAITADGIHANYAGGIKTDHLVPIPINEEILLKCGFNYSSNHIYEYKNNGNILFDEPNDWNNISKYPIGIFGGHGNIAYTPMGEVIIRCIYLHQLQNMYYAITGDELKIEL